MALRFPFNFLHIYFDAFLFLGCHFPALPKEVAFFPFSQQVGHDKIRAASEAGRLATAPLLLEKGFGLALPNPSVKLA